MSIDREPPPQRVTFDLSLKMSMEELARLTPAQVTALIEGIGRVQAVLAQVREPAPPQGEPRGKE